MNRFDNFQKLIAVTTRQKRNGEVDGVDKYFLSLNEFEQKNINNEMCVVNNVFGNMYGYYKEDISKTDDGIYLITELYYDEVKKFKSEYPNTISVYIFPNDISKTIQELKSRNTITEEFNKRVSDIKKEIGFFNNSSSSTFDIIVNNNYDINSIEQFIKQLLLKIRELSYDNNYSSFLTGDIVNDYYRNIADAFANGKSKNNVIYTSFDGDDMHYLYNICNYEINRGNIPLNPETALGYYVSTVSLGGRKIEVMKDCLILEMLSDKMSVYSKEGRTLSEGILAEMFL